MGSEDVNLSDSGLDLVANAEHRNGMSLDGAMCASSSRSGGGALPHVIAPPLRIILVVCAASDHDAFVGVLSA